MNSSTANHRKNDTNQVYGPLTTQTQDNAFEILVGNSSDSSMAAEGGPSVHRCRSKARQRLGLRGSQHLDTSHQLSTSSTIQDPSCLHPTSPDVKNWQQQRYPNGSAFMSIGLLLLILLIQTRFSWAFTMAPAASYIGRI